MTSTDKLVIFDTSLRDGEQVKTSIERDPRYYANIDAAYLVTWRHFEYGGKD